MQMDLKGLRLVCGSASQLMSHVQILHSFYVTVLDFVEFSL